MNENTLGDEAVAELAKTVREVSRRMMNEQPQRGRWQFHGGGAVELCHGLIIEQCNSACSTYRVQRVHRYLRPVCDDDGSGSGSGV
jgi:hypothetical protein